MPMFVAALVAARRNHRNRTAVVTMPTPLWQMLAEEVVIAVQSARRAVAAWVTGSRS